MAGSIVSVVATVMMVAAMRDVWPRHVADRASGDRSDGAADNSARSRAHQPVIQPLPGCRGESANLLASSTSAAGMT